MSFGLCDPCLTLKPSTFAVVMTSSKYKHVLGSFVHLVVCQILWLQGQIDCSSTFILVLFYCHTCQSKVSVIISFCSLATVTV